MLAFSLAVTLLFSGMLLNTAVAMADSGGTVDSFGVYTDVAEVALEANYEDAATLPGKHPRAGDNRTGGSGV